MHSYPQMHAVAPGDFVPRVPPATDVGYVPPSERVSSYPPPRWNLVIGEALIISGTLSQFTHYSDTRELQMLFLASLPAYALLGLARCDLVVNDWSKARERLQEAIAKHPDFIGALSLLVTVSERLGDHATADSLKTGIGRREFSDLPDPWVDDLAEVCFDAYRLSVAAAIANSAGNRTGALDLLDRAIALSPNAGSYHRQAGQLLLDDRNYGAAKNRLEKAVAVNPTDSDAWLRLVDALRGLGQTQPAVSALLTGLSHCPQSPSLHLEYARWLRSANRLDEAIAEFRYGYQLRPSEATPLVDLATTYITAGRKDEAVATLNLALERQPDHPIALATLAFLAISNNDEAEARRRWEQIRRQPKTPAAVVSSLRETYQQRFGRQLP